MSDITVLFEKSLRQSGTSLEAFLATQTISTSDRNTADVVTQLACVDLTVAWGQGAEDRTGPSLPRVEDYSQRLPVLSPEPVELVETEYRARLRRGESPEHSEYTERFPHLADTLPQRLAEIDGSFSSEVTECDAAAETIIQSSVPEPAQTDISDVPVTMIESNAPPSNPEDIRTIIQPEGEASTAPPRKAHGRGAASGVLRTFGDYEVLSEIARGGMGVVYHARQTKLNRVVALKMILQGQLASQDDIRRFYSEAEAAARLEHPGIVPVFEVGEIDDQHYFSMGFVDGESLADLARRGPLPPRDAAELLRDVADAIEYAHQNGVVHRDLKPGNILLTQDGQPRVTDFGLAKTVEGDSGLTASGQILGTPGYMPPEQASGRIHDVGPLSDVYSLGAVLYCLLTGRPPFQSARVMETLRQVVEATPVSPRLLNPSVDRDLETIVLKCLEKEPVHRLASAAELRDELQRYLGGEPVRSRRVGVATRVLRWCRRKPLAAALVASVFVLSGAVTLTVQLAKSAAQTRQFATALGDFEQTLDNAEPTAQWLEQAEQIAGRLEALTVLHGEQQSPVDDSGEPVSGRDARPRVHEAFAALIRRDLRKPKLDADAAETIQDAIRLLADRNVAMTNELQSLLDRRLTDWLIDFELTAPFDDRSTVETVFRGGEVIVSGGALQPASLQKVMTKEVGSAASTPGMPTTTYTMAPLLLAKTQCQDDVQIVATFAPDWQSAQEVGVSLNSEPDGGYDFVIKTLEAKARSGGSAESAASRTLGDALKGNGTLVAEIRRNGTPLHRRPLKLSAANAARLQLRARRVRGDLEFQVNEQAPLRFYDPFSIGNRSPGRFGVRWPAGVSLISLTAQHRPRGEAVSGLEAGDALADEQKFDEAAEQYRQQMAEAADNSIREEAQYKLGLCLTALKRNDEAQELLGPLMNGSDGQWAALAGTQLWVSAIRNRQARNADVIFETLQSRFQFEELAALIPTDVREEILSGYLNAFTTVSNALQFDANRVRNIERGAAVDRLLSHDGLGHYGRQMELVRVYRFTEEWEKALATLKPLLERHRDTVSVRHFARISRFAGQPEQALELIDGIVSGRIEAPTDNPEALVVYLVDRARLHYAMGNLAAAEHDARRAVEIGLSASEQHLVWHNYSQAALMLGFLLESRGQKQAAIDLWRDGYRKCQSLYDNLGAAYHTGLIATQAMGSLSGELSDEDGSRFLKLLTANDSGQSLVTMGTSLVTPQTITEALRDMWRTERGQAAAREFAFETLPLRRRLALPMLLMGHAFVRAKALGRIVSDEQDELIWQVMSDSHRDFMERGTLKMPQLMQLALTWKGTTNFLGWGGVAPLLEPEYRAAIAWMFGHRFLRLGQRDAARRFFETAVKDARAESLTARVAKQDLALLQSEKARLTMTGLSSAGIEVRQAETVIATLDQENPVIELKPGDYLLSGLAPELQRLQCETPISFEAGPEPSVTIRLSVASSATVDVAGTWQSRTDTAPLAGLIGQPAELPGIGRWQVVRAAPQGELRGVTFSPDGQFVAAGCDDGLIRVYETTNWTLMRIFSGHRRSPERAEWSPDGRYLAVKDRGYELLVWDVLTGRLENRLPNLKKNTAGFAWHPKSRSLVVGAYGGIGAKHVSTAGTLLEVLGAGSPQPAPEWSPDGNRLAIVNKTSGSFEIWRPRSSNVLDVSSVLAVERHGTGSEHKSIRELALRKPELEVVQSDPPLWHLAAWSPDGQQVATAAPGRLTVWDTASWRQTQSWDTAATVWIKWQDDSRHLWSAAWSGPVEIRTVNPVSEITSGGLRSTGNDSSSASREGIQLVETGSAYGLPGLRPDGELLARPFHGRLQIFKRDGSLTGDVPWEDAFLVRSLDWSPDGKRLAVAIGSGVVLFDIDRTEGSRELVARQTGIVDPEYAYVSCVRWSPDGTLLATSDNSGGIQLIGSGGKLRQRIRPSESPAHCIDWFPDSRRFVLAGHDGTLRMISREGEVSEPFFDEDQPLFAASVSPDGSQLAASGARQQLGFWSVEGDSIRRGETIPLKSQTLGLCWSPDGSRIAATGATIAIAQPGSSTVIHSRSVGGTVLCADWLPRQERVRDTLEIVAVSDRGHAVTFDGKVRSKSFRPSLGRLPVVRVSPDGRFVAVGTQFKSVELYDTASFKPVGTIVFQTPGSTLSFSGSGEILSEFKEASPPPAPNASRIPSAGETLRWLVEAPTGEQTLLTRSEFYERLRSAARDITPRTGTHTSKPEASSEPFVPDPAGQLSDVTIHEASALVHSRHHTGVFWTISDSGNPARLYAIDASGQLIARYEIQGASNNDWETIMTDDSRTLWIGDVGNLGRRPVRTLYQVSEPDPRADAAAAKAALQGHTAEPANIAPLIELKVQKKITFRPESASDDFEASFECEGRRYLISKVQSGTAALFRLHDSVGSATSGVTRISKVSDLPDLPWITGAAFHSDRRRLALTTYTEVLLFDFPAGDDFPARLVPAARLEFEAPLVESAAFENDRTLLLLSETGVLSRLKIP